MNEPATTRLDHGELVIDGDDKSRVLLIDSLGESISAHRIELPNGFFSWRAWWYKQVGVWRLAQQSTEQSAYSCQLDKSTAFICVSDLAISPSEVNTLTSFIDASSVDIVHSQLMCIGASLAKEYANAMLIIGGAIAVRHVYYIAGKPAFSRLLPPGLQADEQAQSITTSYQHLLNRGMLNKVPCLLTHGLSDDAIQVACAAWPNHQSEQLVSAINAQRVSALSAPASIAVIAKTLYQSRTITQRVQQFIPAYWLGNLRRYRYKREALLVSAFFTAIALSFSLLVGALKVPAWSDLLARRGMLEAIQIENNKLIQAAESISNKPHITAKRLQRLDLLRSVQGPQPVVLLSSLSTVFEAYPKINLNHISWFSLDAEAEALAGQEGSRASLSIEIDRSDSLSVLISGEVIAGTLSEKQSVFHEFRQSLGLIPGLRNLVEEQTPVTQWRMMSDKRADQEAKRDDFVLRFSLDVVSS